MGSTLAKIYVVLSGAILVVVGIVGFFRHEMFNLTFRGERDRKSTRLNSSHT